MRKEKLFFVIQHHRFELDERSETMCEHIDDDRLQLDLRYRFDYICKFLNFTSDDIEMINECSGQILPTIPVIVDRVYRKLFQYDITKNFFVLRNDGFDGHGKDCQNLTLDSVQMTYRRDMLSGYLKRLFLQHQWTDEFLQYLSRIGRLHTNKAGEQSINVDFLHIHLTLSHIEHLMIDFIWSNENLEQKKKKDLLVAINKIFRIQSDLFLLHYLQPNETTLKSQQQNKSSHKHEKCLCS